jgi:hypothetical protein
VANGITHLQLMNIEYFLTCTEEVTTATKADPRAQLLFNSGDYNVFRISGTNGYAEVMKDQPVTIDIAQSAWRDMAVSWYENMDDLSTPIIWDNGDPALKDFATITADQSSNPPQVPINTEGHVVSETLENERFTFDVDAAAVGKPVWIKISYFPNWHVSGAHGPYLASPSFMMVIPTQTHVVMTYGRTWANTVGQVLEVIAWLLLLGLTVWRTILWRRRRRLAGAGHGSAVIPLDEFTGHYLEGRDQNYDKAAGMWVAAPGERPGLGDDLERTADQEGPEAGGAADAEAGHGSNDSEAGAAIARYEAGDQGWGVPPADPPADDQEPRAQEPRRDE